MLRALRPLRALPSARRAFHAAAASRALAKFTMPAMSPTMTEGGISSWKKQEGESFVAGDVLVEIETDKATMDVEAQDEGILAKIMVSDGSKSIPVGTIIAITAEEGDDLSPAAIEAILSEKSESAHSEPPKAAPAPVVEAAKPAPVQEEVKKVEPAPVASKAAPKLELAGERTVILASPLAKRLALEQGIPLAKITGTGPGGRIIREDVENYTPPAPVAAAPAPAPPAAAAKAAPAAAAAAPSATPAAGSNVAYTDTPVSSMRKIIASRLSESKSTIPHYYLTVDINMERVMKLRQVFNGAAKAAESAGGVKDGVKSGVKLSVNDFIVKACALALQDVPEVNSGWHGDFVRRYHTQDISIAVSTPTGLITPIIFNAGALGLSSISASTKALSAKAREGKLQPKEYQGGSFTISNLGMMGIESFTAIINPPQSCILAIGATENKLVLDDTSERGFKQVQVMKVTMSCDHRVVDGAVGAKFMATLKSVLESPLSMML